jgi:hypothetical protein
MKEKDMDTRTFKDKLVNFFKSTRKTSWGKNEVVEQIKELYTEALEKDLGIPALVPPFRPDQIDD